MRIYSFALSTFLVTSSAQFAYSADAEAFIERLNATMDTTVSAAFGSSGLDLKAPQISFTHDPIKTEGNVSKAPNARMIVKGKDDNQISIELGTMEVIGVSELENGELKAEQLSYEKVELSIDDFELTSGPLSISGWVLRDPAEITASSPQIYDSSIMSNLTVSFKGKTVATTEKAEAIQDGIFGETDGALDARIDDIKLVLGNFPDTKNLAPMLNFLDSDTLEFDFAASAAWTREGNYKLQPMSYDVADLGKFSVQFDIDGLTKDFMQRYQQKAAEVQKNPESAMSMLALMSEIYLNMAQIRIDDASITEKVISLFAQKQGVSPETIKQQVQLFLPLGLSRLNNPELASMITEAVKEFLNEPNSLQIDLLPEKSVPIAEVIGAGMAAPTTIPQMVGLSVSANQ